MAAAVKQSKSAAGYKRGGDHCGVCRHFIEAGKGSDGEGGESGQCELVAGDIGEDMVCRLFKRRARTLAESGGGYG